MMGYIYAFVVFAIVCACGYYDSIIEQYTYEMEEEF